MTDNPLQPYRPQAPKSDAGERKTRRRNAPRVRRSRFVHGDDAVQGENIGPFNRTARKPRSRFIVRV